MAYDALNRQTAVTEPTGGILTAVYDAVGNMLASADQLNHRTTFAYDALNRLTATTDARNFTTTLVYDAASNLLALVDPVANRTTYAYDALNRATQETDPLGKNATVAYDAAGRMTSSTDRLGRRIDLTYDNADRLTGQNWVSGGGTVNLFTYTYDNADNLLTAANYNGAYTLAYDAIDRATAMQEPFGMALTYSYDAASNRTLMQDSQGGVLTSVYDAVNRLTSRQFGGASQTPVRIDLAYSARDQVTGITRYSDLAGNTKVGESAYTYDAAGLLTNLQHKNGSSSVLANYTYTYDLAHRVVTETYNGTAKNFTYDNTDQLTNDGTNAYSFDGNGNRTMTGYQTGTGNRTTNDGTWTYTYDDQGNLTKKSKGASAETITYTYDNANRMNGMTDRSTDGGSLLSLATYVYDALSNRLAKDVNAGGTTTVTRFAYDDAGNAWADLNGSSSLTTRRVYLDGTDSQAARISGSTLSFYLTDRLGSIRNQTDAAGVLSNTITYDGFGKVTSETTAANGDRFKFTGRELDSETGLQYHHARYYDPATGRWTTTDPSGFTAGDPNLYRYVTNSPTGLTDPSGLMGDFDANGHHWVTIESLRKYQRFLSWEALTAGVGSYSGELGIPSHTVVNGISHRDYSNELDKNFVKFMEDRGIIKIKKNGVMVKLREMTFDEMNEFLDLARRGRNYDGSRNDLMTKFNAGVKAARTRFLGGRPDPLANLSKKQLLRRGTELSQNEFFRRRWFGLALIGAISSLFLPNFVEGALVAAESTSLQNGILLLARGELVQGEEALFGPGGAEGGVGGFYGELAVRAGLTTAESFRKAYLIAKAKAMQDQRDSFRIQDTRDVDQAQAARRASQLEDIRLIRELRSQPEWLRRLRAMGPRELDEYRRQQEVLLADREAQLRWLEAERSRWWWNRTLSMKEIEVGIEQMRQAIEMHNEELERIRQIQRR